MGKHRYRQLKLKGTRKPNKPNQVPDEKTAREHKIKHLQRYQTKIQNANNEDFLKLVNSLYSYFLNKSIVSDTQFLKRILINQLSIIINAYRKQYNPNEFETVRNSLLNETIKQFTKYNDKDKTKFLKSYLENDLNISINEILIKELVKGKIQL